MYDITGEITGADIFLYNRPSDSDLDPGPKRKKVSETDRILQAERKVLSNGHGLMLDKDAFKNCLVTGCAKLGLKEGKGALWPYLTASVFVNGDLLFGKKTYDFMHKVWGRIPPKTGAMVWIRRPALNEGWKVPFKLTVADDNRDPEEIRISLVQGGLFVGIGSWRPKHGRFLVTKWNVDKKKPKK